MMDAVLSSSHTCLLALDAGICATAPGTQNQPAWELIGAHGIVSPLLETGQRVIQ
jgi:hypothetical protein